MAFEYPKEIHEQHAKVMREVKKLARMRAVHLIATGQMPTKSDIAAYLKENGLDAKPASKRNQSTPS